MERERERENEINGYTDVSVCGKQRLSLWLSWPHPMSLSILILTRCDCEGSLSKAETSFFVIKKPCELFVWFLYYVGNQIKQGLYFS